MEIGQQAIERGGRAQPGRNPIEMLKEGQIFSGKTIKLLPGQMAEIAALGQKVTAQLEAPLQTGERYTFQVTSLGQGIALRVLTETPPASRLPDHASALLEKLGLPSTKENLAFTTAAIENEKPLSSELIQRASGWLEKSGTAEGLDVIRFMLVRNLPLTENVFHALLAARSTDSMTKKMGSLQQLLAQNGLGQTKAATVVGQLLGENPSAAFFKGSLNEKAIQLATALQNTNSSEKAAALEVLSQSSTRATLTAKSGETLLAAMAESPPLNSGEATKQSPILVLKQALFQLASNPISEETVTAFKRAVSLSIPLQHSERPAIMQQLSQLTSGLEQGKPLDSKIAASLFQLASSAAVSVSDQAASRMAVLIGAEALQFEQPLPNSSLRETFRFLGLDHEAVLSSKEAAEDSPQTVKQELLKLMSETMPIPVREAAEQLVGRLNAQHILSAESGPIQQLVMQTPLQFGEFKGDVTIKWEGKKKTDGKIDADFCRVLFYVDMPRLKQTVIDMQVQNRIVHLHIMADLPGVLLKKMSSPAVDSLKQALEAGGYRLSGVSFKEPVPQEKGKPPLARIMDDDGYMGVDIRI